tara:strand:+ start:97 stop:216 length:120 start_codon:yes stop_codon:yes gene_type:complete
VQTFASTTVPQIYMGYLQVIKSVMAVRFVPMTGRAQDQP